MEGLLFDLFRYCSQFSTWNGSMPRKLNSAGVAAGNGGGRSPFFFFFLLVEPSCIAVFSFIGNCVRLVREYVMFTFMSLLFLVYVNEINKKDVNSKKDLKITVT